MRAATTIKVGPKPRALRRPPGRPDSHNKWTERRGPVRYNNLNQVDQVTDTTQSGSNTYDDAGNLLTQPGSISQTNDPASELSSFTSGGSTTNLGFDPRGERATATPSTGPVQRNSYNQTGELTGYINGTTTASYTYNGDGQRTTKTVGSTTSSYSWESASGRAPILLSDGSTNYLYGPDALPVEQIASNGTTSTYMRQRPAGEPPIARCTIERLMGELGLSGAVRGKVKRTTISDPKSSQAA
jgi:YD repeat-containing protein